MVKKREQTLGKCHLVRFLSYLFVIGIGIVISIGIGLVGVFEKEGLWTNVIW